MKEVPLKLEGFNDNIFAGFGTRLASLLLDMLILMPLVLVILYLNSANLHAYYYTLIPNLLINLFYNVYLPKKYGGTPGKLIMGIQIIKLNGEPIGWKESFLRHLIVFLLTIYVSIVTISAISQADEATFESLSWLQQSQYITSLLPILFAVFTWLNNIWTWGELIVLLTNARKRAVHDYIAGTVIVKKIYLEKIRHEINTK